MKIGRMGPLRLHDFLVVLKSNISPKYPYLARTYVYEPVSNTPTGWWHTYGVTASLMTVISVSLQDGMQSQISPGRLAQGGFSVVRWLARPWRQANPDMLHLSASAAMLYYFNWFFKPYTPSQWLVISCDGVGPPVSYRKTGLARLKLDVWSV